MESELFSKYSYRLKEIIKRNKDNTYETALAAIAAYANLSYYWNQYYSDDEIENIICKLSENLLPFDSYEVIEDNNTVLFYDGFGIDTRGLGAIYAKALTDLGYNVVWVTNEKSKGNIPTIESILYQSNSKIEFINMRDSYVQQINELNKQFQKYKPSKAFFYTTPNDVSAELVFYHYRNIVKRFQINLTDHAFWLGLNAFDYCIEFRDYGAGISRVYRHIPVEKIVLLPYYPWIDKDISFEGFPFDYTAKKILFSGGFLYKTIGGENKYYQIVKRVLTENTDTVFLYAGSGDDSELMKLSSIFPNRVFHIQERKDIFALIQHIDVYLNTYPMVGGLMMQYAAVAGKPPITLLDREIEDASGILLNQENAKIEFFSVDDVVSEINHLLNDKEYRNERSEEIKKCVPSQEDFTKNLSDILKENAEYRHADCPDTERFRKEYIGKFNKIIVEDAIGIRKNKSLFRYFPALFIDRKMRKIFRNNI